jgi:leader peptidase (prepilin peptidase)/N-methyltransferase
MQLDWQSAATAAVFTIVGGWLAARVTTALASRPLPLPLAMAACGVVAAAIGYTVLWLIAWSYRRLRGQEGLGMGDAKLAAAAGAWLGLAPLPSVLLLASVAGILWIAIASSLSGRAELSKRIPFGVPLAAAVWIVWLYGPFTFATTG